MTRKHPDLITFGDEHGPHEVSVVDKAELAQALTEPSKCDNESSWYVAELPSKGRAGYSEKVFYRNLLGRDEKMIASATAKNFKMVILDVLKSLMRDKALFSQLTLDDRDFLLMWIWANNYSTERQMSITCEACGHRDNFKVDLTGIPVKDLSEDYQQPFPLTLSNGEVVTLRLKTVSDEQKAEAIVAQNPDLDIEQVELALTTQFKTVMNIRQKLKAMEALTGKDNALIRTFHEYFSYGLKKSLEHECSSCQEVTTFAFPFHAGDFLPTLHDDFGALLQASKRAKAESN